ncbi:MAG TPA: septal ring lytic transglycosylase RlpA family protein [Allosphingosinicella sp.]|jgi:rare lipoprotein A
MTVRSNRLRGVHLFAAFIAAGMISATPLQADIPSNVLQVVQTAQDPAVVAVPAVPAPAVVEDAVEEEASEGKQIGSGEASYYGNELAGNRTASGERFNPRALTAAHRTLPLGSKIRVTNTANGKSVVVRINDRGPFVKSRLIDISYAAAQQINMVRSGKARVKLALIA